MKNTGLKDDFGNIIKDGSTIEWTYYQHGIMITKPNGRKSFLGGLSGGKMIVKKFKKKKKIRYEVRGDIAGYFLDRPKSIATTFIKDKPKCVVVNIKKKKPVST